MADDGRTDGRDVEGDDDGGGWEATEVEAIVADLWTVQMASVR